jgi:hypothetical protein
MEVRAKRDGEAHAMRGQNFCNISKQRLFRSKRLSASPEKSRVTRNGEHITDAKFASLFTSIAILPIPVRAAGTCRPLEGILVISRPLCLALLFEEEEDNDE